MKTALIWGAGGGIGRAIVNELVATTDWTVAAMARQSEQIEDLTPHVFEADVSDPFSVQQTVMSAAQELPGEVDLWVYSIGDITAAPVAEMTFDAWQRILTANLTGAFLAVHHSLPLLAEDAHLVFLGAISERLRLPGLSAYASAKAGLEAFAETLRKEERKRRVTVVRPAAVATGLWDKVPMKIPADSMPPEALARRVVEAYEQGHKGILDLAH